jgi:hypothetical protein
MAHTTSPYREIGPWGLHDFRQIVDWRSVEHNLHYTFRDKRVDSISNQKELFSISPFEASAALSRINPELIVWRPKVDRMFQEEDFCMYLIRLFQSTNLMDWVDIQGAWTFSLFPSTSGGRYFTINIARHEVAFSTLEKQDLPSVHMLFMDRLILDFPDTIKWVHQRGGYPTEGSYIYESALPHSVSLHFEGDFRDALEFLGLEGVRRALVAYWTESLLMLKERGSSSFLARFHNYNAIAELNRRMRASR